MLDEIRDEELWQDLFVEEKQFLFKSTTALEKVLAMKKRIRAVKGGTSASKTISILCWLIDYSQSKQSTKKVVTVASESFPHLRLGAIRDFKAIMLDHGYWNDRCWNVSNSTYTFDSGNIIEFMSMDTYGKAHGPRRDVLFLNECNNLQWDIVDQLIIRTRETVFMDWNPVEEFWFHTELLPHREDDIDYITLTYKDNEALDPITVAEIESHKHNVRWWKTYGLGQDGETTGKIYAGWKLIDIVPHEARLISYGLDYGYTNDPTAIVAIYYYNGGYIVHEIAYTRGLSNKRIHEIFELLPVAPIIADSAEPKSNDELREYGHTVIASKKGPGSVNQGIQFVQDVAVSVTKSSVNIIKEQRNYVWKIDKKTNKTINEPEHEFSHSMDAIRYGFQIHADLTPKKPEYEQPPYETNSLTSQPSVIKSSMGRVGISRQIQSYDDDDSFEQGEWQPPGV